MPLTLTSKERGSITDAIHELAPGAQWVYRGDSLSGLQWLDGTVARPADEDILARAAEIGTRQPPPKRLTPAVILAQLTSKEYDALKAAVVAAGVLTAERADALFATQ